MNLHVSQGGPYYLIIFIDIPTIIDFTQGLQKNILKHFFKLRNVIFIDNNLPFIDLHINLVLKVSLKSAEYWEICKNMLGLKWQTGIFIYV